MKRRAHLTLLSLFLAVATLPSCSTTKPVGEWRSDRFSGRLDNILVIGVTTRHELRYVFENGFVEALAAAGVKGAPGYKLITSTRQLSREEVEKAIRGHEFDGVLITRLVGSRQKDVYQLPADYDYERGYFGYYDHALQETNEGYYAQYRILTLQTNLYDVASEALVWSMKSETMDASKPRDIIEDQIDLTIKTLLRHGLIGTKS